jgi:DNA repair exonuclease SbcCD ATPase subunit
MESKIMAKKRSGKGKKECPECNTPIGTRARKCSNPKCDYIFPIKSKSGGKATWNKQLENLRQSLLARKGEIGEAILALKAEEKEINKRLDKLS